MSSSSFAFQEDDEETLEHTLLVVREVSVYKIPPRTTSGGYKCGEWLQSDKIWSGRLRVVSGKERCEIRLEEPNSGDLFAACFVNPGQRESSVESVLDSSRYFVLKIEDGHGKHAFIGLGFAERNEAFDFNVALSDHQKYAKRVDESSLPDNDTNNSNNSNETEAAINIHPAVNHRLKEGETIRINVKHKSATSGTGMLSAAAGKTKPGLGIAPPPVSNINKIKSPLPPPPNDPAVARIGAAGKSKPIGDGISSETKDDAFSDFSSLKKNLPGTTARGPGKPVSSGWAAF